MLGERIKNLRTNNKMTQHELAVRLKVSDVTISSWESDKKTPSLNAIVAISKLFRVSIDSLLDLETPTIHLSEMLKNDEHNLLQNYRKLDNHGKKVVNAVCSLELERASLPAEAEERRLIKLYTIRPAAGSSVPFDEDEYEMVQIGDDVPNGAEYCVCISGDSMAPYIHDGDIVYVERTETLNIGDVGIISVDGSLYCKQYFCKKDGTLILVSANPDLKHTNVVVKPDGSSFVKIFGRVLLDRKIDFPDYLYEDM